MKTNIATRKVLVKCNECIETAMVDDNGADSAIMPSHNSVHTGEPCQGSGCPATMTGKRQYVSRMRIVSLNDDIVDVDTDDMHCGLFGFRHGDIIDLVGDSGVIMGIESDPKDGANPNITTIWFVLDKNLGKATCLPIMAEGEGHPLLKLKK